LRNSNLMSCFVVALGETPFYDLLRHARAAAYVVFDLIWLDGADLRLLPLTERRRHLQNIPAQGLASVSEGASVTGRGHKLFELMCAHDLEGIVANRLKDPYDPASGANYSTDHLGCHRSSGDARRSPAHTASSLRFLPFRLR